MSSLSDIEKLLPTLSAGEKAQVLKCVVQELGDAFPGIDSRPDVCAGEPCVVRTRIPVWLLERARQSGVSEHALLEAYPSLRAEDLVNAWAYVRSHGSEIESLFHNYGRVFNGQIADGGTGLQPVRPYGATPQSTG